MRATDRKQIRRWLPCLAAAATLVFLALPSVVRSQSNATERWDGKLDPERFPPDSPEMQGQVLEVKLDAPEKKALVAFLRQL